MIVIGTVKMMFIFYNINRPQLEPANQKSSPTLHLAKIFLITMQYIQYKIRHLDHLDLVENKMIVII